jgi:hypothetical protein
MGPLFVSALALLACGPRQAGDRCATNDECAPGLVCMGEACVDGVKVSKDRATRIATLVQRYMHENKGDCPTGIDEFRSTGSISDAWGKDFQIRCPGRNFVVDVVSAGPDGKHETDDDVANVEAPAGE